MSDLKEKLRRQMGSAGCRSEAEKQEVISDLKEKLRSFHHPESRFAKPPEPTPPKRAPRAIAEVVSGRYEETPFGPIFAAEERFPYEHQRGAVRLHDLFRHSRELLGRVFKGAPQAPPEFSELIFLDTETTGLAGGTGTCPFLVGIGYFRDDAFCLKQYFMENFDREAALLHQLGEILPEFRGLVTFNGKTYDAPLLASRFILSRMRPPFSEMFHLDLLHSARRLFRERLESCRLTALEAEVLEITRTSEDLPGELIPQRYFDYLSSCDAAPLQPVFYHNREDILSLVNLLARILDIHRTPEDFADFMPGVARHRESVGESEAAISLYLQAAGQTEAPGEHYLNLRRASLLLKRTGKFPEACEIWRKMIALAEDQDIFPYVELAKYYEHRERNLEEALNYSEAALKRLAPEFEDSRQWLEHRRQRIKSKLAARKIDDGP